MNVSFDIFNGQDGAPALTLPRMGTGKVNSPTDSGIPKFLERSIPRLWGLGKWNRPVLAFRISIALDSPGPLRIYPFRSRMFSVFCGAFRPF